MINIPVHYVSAAQHATPYFSTEGKYLSHGDDPYDAYIRRAKPPIPGSELLIDEATYRAWFAPPISPEKRLANVGRQTLELAIKYLTELLLVRRCQDIRSGSTNHQTSLVYSAFRNIYAVAELEAMDLWTRMDAKIASLGGCANIPLQ